MNEHVGIAMSKQSERMVYLYAAEPQLAVWDKTMNVESKSYAYFHLSFFFFNKFLLKKIFTLNKH